MQRTPHPWLIAPLVLLATVCALGSLSACSNSSTSGKALPTATSGNIKIAVAKAQYTANEPVGVTVTNTSSQTYYAVSGRSACTYLQLQEYDAAKNTWLNVSACPAANPTPLQISPKLSLPFTLAPNSNSDPNAWDPGTYRVVLAYGTNADGSNTSTLAYSAAFTIVSG